MHEIIIAIYDSMYCYSVVIDGKPIYKHEAFEIAKVFDWAHDNEIIPLMKKYNCNRLILVNDGCVEIYTR